jgi:hypothetical protein
MRWERYGTDWINMKFRSKMDNIFILEKENGGTNLYCFDDGPEIPTEGITLVGEEEEKLRVGIEERKRKAASEQEICEFLFAYFPGLRDYWKRSIEEFDSYEEAKRFAIARAREFGTAAYLWGHHELEPDIPNQSGYKRLC